MLAREAPFSCRKHSSFLSAAISGSVCTKLEKTGVVLLARLVGCDGDGLTATSGASSEITTAFFRRGLLLGDGSPFGIDLAKGLLCRTEL